MADSNRGARQNRRVTAVHRLASLLLVAAWLIAGASPAGAVSPPARMVAAESGPVTSAIVPGSVDRTSLNLSARYDVSATLRYGDRSLVTRTILAVTNLSGGPIDRLELNTIAARLGRIRLGAVSVDGVPVTARVSDQTLLVPLGGVLPDGATAVVSVGYRATLRSGLSGSDWLFTRANLTIDLYRWIPWVSRIRRFDRPNHGDPFVTASAPSVRVRIATDRPMGFATSGRRVARSANGLSQTFVAENVRDFNLTASPYYRTLTGTAGDTRVQVLYRAGAPAATMLAWAKRALTRMEALVGPYPYPTFMVGQSAGGYGMESPGLIWIPAGIASSRLPYLISHETAHQWFYGTVGNDQAGQPFADEAAADFLARYTLGQRRASRCSTTTLDRSIYQYSSSCYYEVVYIQGGNFLDGIRRRMGSSAFWAGLRDYVHANRFGLGSTRELLDTLDAHTPLNLVPRYEPRFPRLY
jgi:hypothetical protein